MKTKHILILLSAAIAIIILVASLTSKSAPLQPLNNDQRWGAIAPYCDFADDGGAPDEEIITGPDGRQLTVIVWELWHAIPDEDDNPIDALEAGYCERHFTINVQAPNTPDTWPERWIGNLHIEIHQKTGITAERYGQHWDEQINDNIVYDKITSRDVIKAEGLDWLYGLDLKSRTSLRKYWLNVYTGEVSPRVPLTDDDSKLVDVFLTFEQQFGIRGDVVQPERLPLPTQLGDESEYNFVELRQGCRFVGKEPVAGHYLIICQKWVAISIDDPNNPDIFTGTTILDIYSNHNEATLLAEAFSIYTHPSPSPEQVIAQYSLAPLIPGYCRLTKTVAFRMNMYTGALVDPEVNTCSQ